MGFKNFVVSNKIHTLQKKDIYIYISKENVELIREFGQRIVTEQ